MGQSCRHEPSDIAERARQPDYLFHLARVCYPVRYFLRSMGAERALAEPGANLEEEVIPPQHLELESSSVSGATKLAMRFPTSGGQWLDDTLFQTLPPCFRLRIQ